MVVEKTIHSKQPRLPRRAHPQGCLQLGSAVRVHGVKRGGFLLRRFGGIAKHMAGGCKKETCFRHLALRGPQQVFGPLHIDAPGFLNGPFAFAHVRLCRKMVNFIGLRLLHGHPHLLWIGHIAFVTTPTVHLVAFALEQLAEIPAILSGDSRDEGARLHPPCPTNLRSSSTISFTSPSNVVPGSQPSCSRALAGSPKSKSTSAGR